MSNAKTNIQNLADCLFDIDDTVLSFLARSHAHLEKCVKAASFVRNPSKFAAKELDKPSSQELSETNYTSTFGPTATVSSSDVSAAVKSTLDAMNSARNNVIAVMREVNRFISRARTAGFVPPQNPFLAILRMNIGRTVNSRGLRELKIDDKLADDLAFSIDVFLKLRDLEKSGELDFDNPDKSSNSAQISSFSFSLDGFKFATDASVDLLSFIPDGDTLKRKRIEETLSSLTFDKRITKMLFTSNFDPDDVSKGVIVGWKRMPDASGYIITRTDVFDGTEKEFRFSNSDITKQYSLIRGYVKDWILSFYDKSVENNVLAFVDNSAQPNKFYKYKVKGYQIARSDREFIFDVNLAKGILSKKQLNEIEQSMKEKVYGAKRVRNAPPSTVFAIPDISPYPFISKKIYKTNKFDWIISAVNVTAAVKRGDVRSDVRKYSYLGSSFNFIKSKIDDFKFFLPADVDIIIKNINDSISTFGVSQTLLDVFQSTGLVYFISNKEDTDDDETSTFSRPDQIFDDPDVSLMSDILSSIDADTATVDVGNLVNNLSKSDFVSKKSEISSTPTELTVNEEFSEDPFQFIQDVDVQSDVLDLATFEGISDFVRIIRAYFDSNPGRAAR